MSLSSWIWLASSKVRFLCLVEEYHLYLQRFGNQNHNFSGTSCFKHALCLHWQFKCDDGQECIHAMAKCDGHRDCTDGSDESSHWCSSVAFDKWPCDNKKASIARTLVCNGYVFFQYNVWESYCAETLAIIEPNIFCILYLGAEDCADGSDEAHCRCTNPLFYFDCTFGPNAALHPAECISRELVCNGISNCYAGQDEEKQVKFY